MQISYGSESKSTDGIPHFFRTLPSHRASNYARVRLMDQFSWHRIAVIPDTSNRHYHKVRPIATPAP